MPIKKKKKNQQSGDGLYDWVANNLLGANLSKGEVHAPQYTQSGWRFGNFIGPGTNVYNNIRNGKMPITNTDKVAKAHDLRYGLARSNADMNRASKQIDSLNQNIESTFDAYTQADLVG